MPGHLAVQERRKDVRKINLLGVSEITPRQILSEREYAEVDVLFTENPPQLTDDLFHAYVFTRVAGTVVGSDKQFELPARPPRAILSSPPAQPGKLDEETCPCFQQ